MTSTIGRIRLTAAEQFWYVLQCIAFGAGYFAKVPVKKALSEIGLAEMTGAEQFWYVLQCVAFGAGYFAKVPVKKALTELGQIPGTGYTGITSGQSGTPRVGGAYGAIGSDDQSLAASPGSSEPAARRPETTSL
jgi:hypothetical protein